jgi:hypothetical protein
MNKKIKVVLEFDFDQARGLSNIEEAAVSLVQQAVSQIPGVGLVSINEIVEVNA